MGADQAGVQYADFSVGVDITVQSLPKMTEVTTAHGNRVRWIVVPPLNPCPFVVASTRLNQGKAWKLVVEQNHQACISCPSNYGIRLGCCLLNQCVDCWVGVALEGRVSPLAVEEVEEERMRIWVLRGNIIHDEQRHLCLKVWIVYQIT